MKIVVCCSISMAKKVMKISGELTKVGHEIILPKNIEKYADGTFAMENATESTQNKINEDLIRGHFEKIKNSEAVLVVNENKNGIANYIGGNTFLEMGFAHVLNKKIFLLNPVPEVSYGDEIIAMQPVVLNGNLALIN